MPTLRRLDWTDVGRSGVEGGGAESCAEERIGVWGEVEVPEAGEWKYEVIVD